MNVMLHALYAAPVGNAQILFLENSLGAYVLGFWSFPGFVA
jgi:hypothetical protein